MVLPSFVCNGSVACSGKVACGSFNGLWGTTVTEIQIFQLIGMHSYMPMKCHSPLVSTLMLPLNFLSLHTPFVK